MIIKLETEISAPIDVCFDLSRSVDAHLFSTRDTGERVVAGVMTGLMNLNDTVTWQAKHVWTQRLTSRIVAFDRPHHFRDSMVSGFFKRFDHDHFFEERGTVTLVKDCFDFESPFSVVGRIVDAVYLQHYLRRFLQERNRALKQIAEHAALCAQFLPGC
ncbi:MAG: SRPBCC family protein [Candidatus Obscuribacterales bacterium]